MKQSFNMRFLIIAFAMLLTTQVSAQSRDYIREQIEQWGECRNVALTETNGDVALYSTNGFAQSGCPESLVEAINTLHEEQVFIDDIQLTEAGNWVILYGKNGVLWHNIPASLEKEIRKYNAENETIRSITFNDNGEWIIISKNRLTTSSAKLTQWVTSETSDLGSVWAACITNDAAVVVYENGYIMDGNVPESLNKALDEVEFDVYRLKISGQSWFIADVDGNNDYVM